MTTLAWIQLITQVGIPAAERLWKILQSKKEITAEDWAALKLEVSRPIGDYEGGPVL